MNENSQNCPVPFSIKAESFEWINGCKDDPDDLCSHGNVTLKIGPETISCYCCTSAAALRMIRTLTEDRNPQDGLFGEQMLPCCGFNMYADETLENVTISGCDSGTDYSVRHQGNLVILTLENGHAFAVSMDNYTREVLQFARRVEDFYRCCSVKKIPENSIERDGYAAFWNEWRRRTGERQLKNGGKEAAEAEIEIIKNEINRKLYQKPPLLNA